MISTIRSMFRSAGTVAKKYARSVVIGALIGRLGVGSLAYASAGMTVTRDTALKVAAYKRGVQLIADYIGKTPFHVRKENAKDKSHAAWKLVRKWARHHELSAFEFRRVLTIHMLTTGNGYGYIERDANAKPLRLHVLDPRKIEPTLRNGVLVYAIDGSTTVLESSDVIHIRGFCTDGFKGLDPILNYATEVLGLALAQQQYAAKYYENGGTPQTYLRTDEFLDEEAWAKLQSQSGPLKRSMNNPHEIPVLEKADLKSVSLSAEQTQLLGAREFSLKDIANLLGMPAHKLGGSDQSSYGSLEEENRSFRDDTLDPILVQFEIEYEKLLTEVEQALESHSVEAVRESLERTNMAVRADVLQKAVGGPHMTQNEAREIVSLPPVDGGDELLQPANMLVLGQQTGGSGSGTDSSKQRTAKFDALCRAALKDVCGRMTKRLTTQATRTKPDQWTGWLDSIEANHAAVIRSAFEPLLPLCGGDEVQADTLATRFIQSIRSQLAGIDTTNASSFTTTVAERSAALETRADTLAGEVLSVLRNRV